MMGRYREAVISFKLIVYFYNKYRQLYSKSYQYEQMNRNYEKAVSLLAISLIFYPEALDDNLQ
jgi:translation initiation factor 3 subunit L